MNSQEVQPFTDPAAAPFDPEGDIIGVIKIKDGIFICDEFGA